MIYRKSPTQTREEPLELRAPDAELQRILQRYTDLAQRSYDGCDIWLGGYSSRDEVAMATGSAKIQNAMDEIGSKECLRVLTQDLACQYPLDAGVKVDELGELRTKLPRIFDSLPAILVSGVEKAVAELGPDVPGAAARAAASLPGLWFQPYYDEPGIVVDTVYEKRQAQKAGLRRNDAVTGANDTLRFGNMWDYDMFKVAQPVAVPFVLNILRAGRPLRLTASFASQ